jgi:hypothetical protein
MDDTHRLDKGNQVSSVRININDIERTGPPRPFNPPGPNPFNPLPLRTNPRMPFTPPPPTFPQRTFPPPWQPWDHYHQEERTNDGPPRQLWPATPNYSLTSNETMEQIKAIVQRHQRNTTSTKQQLIDDLMSILN